MADGEWPLCPVGGVEGGGAGGGEPRARGIGRVNSRPPWVATGGRGARRGQNFRCRICPSYLHGTVGLGGWGRKADHACRPLLVSKIEALN